jgi:hypothetical protein
MAILRWWVFLMSEVPLFANNVGSVKLAMNMVVFHRWRFQESATGCFQNPRIAREGTRICAIFSLFILQNILQDVCERARARLKRAAPNEKKTRRARS